MVSGAIRQFTNRSSEGSGGPVLDSENGEELMHVLPGVAIVLANRPSDSSGTLYITSKQVVWLSEADREKGYAVDFLSISLHAISKDPEAYSSPCLYAQIDIETDEESEDSDSECGDALDLTKVREMRLVPSDPDQLDNLFEVFCECAELNPEPNEDEEEEEHNWVFSADQMDNDTSEDPQEHFTVNPTNSIGYSNGDHDLARTVLELRINDQRFEDAEEMEHESNGNRS